MQVSHGLILVVCVKSLRKPPFWLLFHSQGHSSMNTSTSWDKCLFHSSPFCNGDTTDLHLRIILLVHLRLGERGGVRAGYRKKKRTGWVVADFVYDDFNIFLPIQMTGCLFQNSQNVLSWHTSHSAKEAQTCCSLSNRPCLLQRANNKPDLGSNTCVFKYVI